MDDDHWLWYDALGENQAMASFGLMAVIGEICCLAFALIFMTAYLACVKISALR
ncbi:MAG: hypothetical protein U1F16_06645 [Turneriella sp.]